MVEMEVPNYERYDIIKFLVQKFPNHEELGLEELEYNNLTLERGDYNKIASNFIDNNTIAASLNVTSPDNVSLSTTYLNYLIVSVVRCCVGFFFNQLITNILVGFHSLSMFDNIQD